MNKKPIRIYFLCIHNRGRSQMAEAFAKRYGGDHVIVESAGIEESTLHPLTVEVMHEIGYDLSDHYSKRIDMNSFMKANVVVKLCEQLKERCPVVPFGIKSVEWNLPDPLNVGDMGEIRVVRDEIETKVKELLQSLGALRTEA